MTKRQILSGIGAVLGLFGMLAHLNYLILPNLIASLRGYLCEFVFISNPKTVALINLFLTTPTWFRYWITLFGITGILVSGFYFYQSLRLLADDLTIPRFRHTLNIILGFNVLKLVTAMLVRSHLNWIIGLAVMFQLLLHIVLYFIAREAEAPEAPNPLPSSTDR